MAAITKKRFYDELGQLLALQGWMLLPKFVHPQTLFGRRHRELICTLEVNESRSFPGQVSLGYFLAGHSLHGLVFKGYPLNSRVEIERHLTPEERNALFGPEDDQSRHRSWWERGAPETAGKINTIIRLTSPRFLEDQDLAKRIREHEEHARYVLTAQDVARTPDDGRPRADGHPPPSWVEAARRVASPSNPKDKEQYARAVAADAWVTYRLLPPR